MNIVVADACPVIFLAKLDRLALIRTVFPGTILIPASVRRELTQETIPTEEKLRIEEFLKHCRVETVQNPRFPATALSLADRHVLTLATRHRKAIILTDDSLLRRIALAQGQPVAGTLGLIIRATRAKLIQRQEALNSVDELVTKHQLRITVDVYQEACRQINESTLNTNHGATKMALNKPLPPM
jgi:predicted nucleic acid-binding protein